MRDDELYELAASHHGLLHRLELREALTRRQYERWIRLGRIVRIRPQVYRIAGTPETPEQAALAICMAAGRDAVASGVTAARLRGLEVPALEDTRPEITVARYRRVRIPGVRVHNTMVFGPIHADVCRGVPVTSVARTLCDLTARYPEWMIGKFVDQALIQKMTTLARLQDVFEDLATRGRHTSTRMRSVLEARGCEFDDADSVREARVVRVLREAGLPVPSQQVPVTIGRTTYRLDVAYPDLMIDIEYDSWEFHGVRSAFDGDRTRSGRLQAKGWAVLQFTSAHSDSFIVRTVTEMLATRRALHDTRTAS